jgi:hypothetical protein
MKTDFQNYQDYLNVVHQKLDNDGFKVDEYQNVGEFRVSLLGYHRERLRRYTIFCYVTMFDKVDSNLLEDYSEAVGQHAKRTNVVPGNVLIYFPVLASSKFGDELKDHIRKYQGRSYTWKWGIGCSDHPVLAELATRTIFHYDSYPFMTDTMIKKSAKLGSALFSF